jgi:solute carrier family 25 (adenine nucleotide translocator) protein 4/5/6/31
MSIFHKAVLGNSAFQADRRAIAFGKKKSPLNPFEDFMIGGTVAGVSKTIAAPIERIKLLLQNQGESKAIAAAGEYKGIMDIIRRVPQEQGVAAFWRGNTANVIRYFPTQALNLMFKERYKELFKVEKTAPFAMRMGSNIAAGGAAGATSLCFVYPLDFARTRLAMDTGSGKAREFNGTLDCILKTAKTSGWFGKGGVYNGFGVSCFGIILYRGAYFGLYDTATGLESMKGANAGIKFAVAYAVTTVAGIVAYPIDTIRRRMMMTSGSNAGKYKSAFHAASVIQSESGVGAFFKGAGSNILRGLCGALVLVGFDEVKNAYIKWRVPDYKFE